MSGIGGVYDFELNSTGYKLSRQPRTGRPVYAREEAPQFVNRNASGDSFYRDATFWSHWVQLTWQNGTKQEFWNDAGRFWKNEGTDPTESEKLTLSKVKQTHSQIASKEVTSLSYRMGGYTLMAGLSDGALSAYTTGPWTHSTNSVSGRINKVVNVVTDGGSNYLVATVGEVSGGGVTCPDAAVIWTAGAGWNNQIISAHAGATLDFCMYYGGGSDRFYATGTNDGRVYRSAALGSGWELHKLLRPMGYPWALKEYANYLFIGGGKPYGGTTSAGVDDNNYNGALWRHDGTNYDLVAPFDWTEITALEVYNGTLFIGTFHGEVFIYDLASLDKLFDLPGKPRINKMITFKDQLHIFTAANSDGSHWIFDRRGFHRPSNVSAKIVAGVTYRNDLIPAVYDGSTNSDFYKFEGDVDSYEPGGTVQSSYFDANLPSLNKLWKEATLQWDSLPDETSIGLSCKYDEADAWTSLGTISASGSSLEYTIPFPSASYSNKLSYLMTLSTSVSTSTPILRRMITKYRTVPDFYYRWQLGVDTSDKVQTLDGAYYTSSGRDIQSKLLEDKRTKSVFNFKDIDYTSAIINGALGASAAIIPVFSDPTTLFPLQGRLRISATNEEVTYTSANTSAFTGVTRGIKNTTPTSAATSALIDNSYRVIYDEIEQKQFQLNLLADRIENVTPITLLEI
jgi:hypothetical protein